jgi:hypothetical protein
VTFPSVSLIDSRPNTGRSSSSEMVLAPSSMYFLPSWKAQRALAPQPGDRLTSAQCTPRDVSCDTPVINFECDTGTDDFDIDSQLRQNHAESLQDAPSTQTALR